MALAAGGWPGWYAAFWVTAAMVGARTCAMATNRYIALKSWSAFTFNLPFSRLAIVVGDPIVVPDGAGPIELEATRLAVENGLNDVTKRAYRLAGGKDPLASPAKFEVGPGQ